MILAGDVGGTKCNLALFEPGAGSLVERAGRRFPSADYPRFEDVVAEFLRTVVEPAGVKISAAGIGVAGPVSAGVSVATNLPWRVDAKSLAALLGLPRVALVNDLEANAFGIGVLGPSDFEVLSPGAPAAQGLQAVIAAGTGLGEAGLYWDGKMHRPISSEGGHADLAPRNELEDALVGYLRKRFGGHVSCERVLSGPGLRNVFDFLRDTGRGTAEPWLEEGMQKEDASAMISRAALDGKSPICMQALDIFVSLYGSEAGNLALTFLATGGLFVGGGIAPKILPKLRGSVFLEAFFSKGRLRPLLEQVPVRVILNDRTALLGAARCALLSH
ncbi:MAG TPA: glucokinase [Candidatus Acidoferrales bacterium]|nr:glucokinase [Candidatus Acidoferrales bacterium]